MSTCEWNEQALSLIGKAVLAPSSHNTQPWLFRITSSAIDLYADRTRALPVNDPEDRELTISCGCALMNLRVAAASHGLRVQVQLRPASEEPDWLARVSFTNESGAPAAEATLSEFIEHRHTYRKRFAAREVDSATLDQLIEAANAEGAWLRPLVSEEARQQVATVVAEGDAAQWANPSWRRELAAWMHPRCRGDGLTVPALAAPVAQLAVRTFDMGGNGQSSRTSPAAGFHRSFCVWAIHPVRSPPLRAVRSKLLSTKPHEIVVASTKNAECRFSRGRITGIAYAFTR